MNASMLVRHRILTVCRRLFLCRRRSLVLVAPRRGLLVSRRTIYAKRPRTAAYAYLLALRYMLESAGLTPPRPRESP